MSQNLADLNLNEHIETSSIELAIPKRDSSVEGEIESDDDAPAEEDEEDVRDAEDFGREELMRKIEATKKKIEREQARAE